MKKSLLILAAASAVAFAACNGGNNEGSYTQEQVDSIAKWKADSATNAVKASNDSMINAQANAEARSADSLRVIDSIVAATKKSSTTTVIKKTSGNGGKSTTTTTKTVVTEEPAPQVPVNPKAARFGDEEAKKQVSEQATQNKADRFKGR